MAFRGDRRSSHDRFSSPFPLAGSSNKASPPRVRGGRCRRRKKARANRRSAPPPVPPPAYPVKPPLPRPSPSPPVTAKATCEQQKKAPPNLRGLQGGPGEDAAIPRGRPPKRYKASPPRSLASALGLVRSPRLRNPGNRPCREKDSEALNSSSRSYWKVWSQTTGARVVERVTDLRRLLESIIFPLGISDCKDSDFCLFCLYIYIYKYKYFI